MSTCLNPMFFFNFQEILNLGKKFFSWFPYISVTCLLLWCVIHSLVLTSFYYFKMCISLFLWFIGFDTENWIIFYYSTQNNYYFSKKLLLFKTVVFYYFSNSFQLLLPDFYMLSISSLSLWLWSCFYHDKSFFGTKFM